MGLAGTAGSVSAGGQLLQWPKRSVRRRNRLADVTVSVALPWLVFFLITSLFLFAYHEMRLVVWVLIGLCVCLAFMFMILGAMGRHGAFTFIGVMCLLSVSLATTVGAWLHGEYLERYWQLQHGSVHKDVDPAADPTRTKDAGIITFATDTFVDDSRTLGFVADGGIFCVAPVVTPPYYTDKVSYWAVGSNCCQSRSGFDCGSARDLMSVSALLEPTQQRYSEAINQATSVYGLTSVKGAQLVSFVDDPLQAIGDMWDETLTIALVAMLADLSVCALAGVAMAKLLILPQQDSEKTPLRK